MFDKEELKWWAFRILVSPIAWILVLLVLGLEMVGDMGLEDAVRADQHYCQMVKLYKDTRGDAGWPDYEGTYDANCPK